MDSILRYRALFDDYLNRQNMVKEPRALYEPIGYIIGLGGKRIRPVLTLMSADAFGTDPQKALGAALAVEMFHNFSLVHDDIMDDASLRRGHETVHEKWDTNTAILSGDAMLILAYRNFEQYPPETFRNLAGLFSKTALEVCEGQQWDVDFETRSDVSLEAYIKMIEYKTAVLVGAALQMGAMIADAPESESQKIYEFGRHLGIAFQLQDDFLDAFGDQATFGKRIGGDIIEGKKTYLYLKAAQHEDFRQDLLRWYAGTNVDPETKIASVKRIFEQSGAASATQQAIAEYTDKAFEYLETLQIDADKKQILRSFGRQLMSRDS